MVFQATSKERSVSVESPDVRLMYSADKQSGEGYPIHELLMSRRGVDGKDEIQRQTDKQTDGKTDNVMTGLFHRKE